MLSYRAWHDPLTGLLSRTGIVEVIDDHLAPAANALAIAALAIDLDNFTAVNDSLGHDAGDHVLRAVGGRLALALRQTDLLARIAGDEFAAVLTGVVDDEAARRTARRIGALLAEPVLVDSVPVYVTASIGVAVCAVGSGASNVLGHASMAMRRAKARGRNRVELYCAELQAAARSRLVLEADLRRAIEWGELTVLYQPIVASDDAHLLGFEALVRWDHPEHGRLRPDQFLDIAEQVELIGVLDEQVLGRMCEQLAIWGDAYGRDDLIGAVNLSPRSLARDELARVVQGNLERTGVSPARLHLEITEDRLMEDLDVTVAALDRLKAIGVRLAIDDFGTGHSSLAHVSRFGVHVLKIDRSFVEPLGHPGNGAAVIEAITALAARFGLDTVIEGIETSAQFDQVAALGVDAVQGFLFSRPVDVDAANAMVAGAPPRGTPTAA